MSLAKHLIIDSAGFIKNAPIKDICEEAYSTNDVVSEIRDKATRQRLQVLPYDLHLKSPSVDSLKFVNEYSKKTGDYPSLSATDLKVIALTYELHVKSGGEIKQHANTGEQWNVPKSESIDKAVNIAGFYLKGTHITDNKENNAESTTDGGNPDEVSVDNKQKTSEEQEQDRLMAELSAGNRVANTSDGEERTTSADEDCYNDSDDEEEHSDEEEDSDDDGQGWITPGNISQVKVDSGEFGVGETDKVDVACLTTDFAMQNVLLQMGLHVLSVNGMLIKRARSYVLRCFACFKITTLMNKEFCYNCGNKTLKKFAKVVNSNGEIEYNTMGRKQLSTRGMKYSLPAPKGGKHSNNPVLCEDQRKPHERPCGRYLKKGSGNSGVLGDDFNCSNGNSPFAMIDTESRAALAGIRANKRQGPTFRSRKNPNENARRRK